MRRNNRIKGAEQLPLFTFEAISKKMAHLEPRPNDNGKFWLVSACLGQELTINTKAKALLAVTNVISSGDSCKFCSSRVN